MKDNELGIEIEVSIDWQDVCKHLIEKYNLNVEEVMEDLKDYIPKNITEKNIRLI